MNADNDYLSTLRHLWEKSLILHDTSLFNKTLYFYFLDSLAHIDYTCSIYAFNYQSPKNIIGGEYMRWRIDEEKKGDRAKFPAFIAWLKEEHPEKFATLPSLWQMLYDPRGPGRGTAVSGSCSTRTAASRYRPKSLLPLSRNFSTRTS